MSGPGDIGGEVSGDEAAWRDLIARFDSPATQATEAAPWPASEDLPDGGSPASSLPDGVPDGQTSDGLPGEGQPGDGLTGDGLTDGGRPSDPQASGARAVEGFVPPEGMRIIRFTSDPRAYSPPEEPDEPYVPEPLPPPARLDAMSKAAWVALICGPGYLLLGTVLGWSISGTEALVAIAAFIAGFVTLVVKMGDRPPRDDDDDGAML
jgi:hypothetical protein